MKMPCVIRLCLLSSTLLLPLPSQAHNGALAVAVPLQGITVDGDLADWPAGMRRYSILLPEAGDAPRDTADFQASFRLGYNLQENALYVAVEVVDESYVVDPSGGAWNTQDGCEVYVDLQHQEQDSPAVQYNLFGRERSVLGPGGDEDFAVAVKQGGNKLFYEWRIDVGRMSRGKMHLGPSQVVGFDVVVEDKDEDGSFSWMAWGRWGEKVASTDRRGDALLVGGEGRLGKLRTSVRWEDASEGVSHARVRIQSLSTEKVWVQVEADPRGVCEVDLPEGQYRAGVVGLRRSGEDRTASMRAGATAEIVLQVKPPQGELRQAGPGKGHWRSFGPAGGLPSSMAWDMLQDRQGDLWFTTGSGVSRYNGQQFRTFTTQDGLAHDQVHAIGEDQEGNLWFGTEGGVSRFDGQHFQTFTTRDGLPSNMVAAVVADRQGHLWFGTTAGVSRFDGNQFQNFTTQDGLVHNQVTCALEDREGHLWFGTRGGVSRFDGQHFQSFTPRHGLPNNQITSILQDRDGNLWFGTNGGGACRYDGKDFTTFDTRNGLANNAVSQIAQDQEGHLWFATFGGGVSRYGAGQGRSGAASPADQRFTTFTTADGLGDNYVASVLEDQEGNLWFGTWRGGVSRYDGHHFTTFTSRDGLAADRVGNLLEDRNGHLWFSTEDGGVCRYDGRSFTCFGAEDGLALRLGFDQVLSMVQDRQGNLWFGTWAGASRYDGKHFQTFTAQEGLASNAVTAIAEDKDGNLWFGTSGGMSRLDGQQAHSGDLPDLRFETFSFQDTLSINYVTSIAQDAQGSMWFGTRFGGAYRYDGKRFSVFTTAEGLPHDQIAAIERDGQGDLWFVTYGGGVSHYDGKTFETFTTKDGLPHNWVTSVAWDAQGHLWLGTGGGVGRYDGRVFQRILGRDGLPDEVVNQVLPMRSGEVWIATQTGLTRYRPSHSPPAVQLTSAVTSRRLGPIEELSLPSSQDYLAFEFQGRSLTTRPEGMTYAYRLEGYDADWRPSYEGRAEYAGLPRGEYLFQVKAVDRDLNYSETPATVRVRVHLPYERLAWTLALALAVLLVAWQTGRVVRRDQRLARQNRDLEQANVALQVEAALERVGAAVAGMQRSADIGKVMRVMWEELRGQRFEFAMCAVTIVDEAHNLRTSYNVNDLSDAANEKWWRQVFSRQRLPQAVGVSEELLTEKGLALSVVRSPLDADDWARASAERWRDRRIVARAMTQEEIAGHARRLGIAPEDYRTRYFAFVPFAHGELSLATTNPDPDQLSSADLALLQRFAEVFDGGYARFLDFQRLERDRAAEQVRNRVSSMEHVGDLDGVVLQLRDELLALGIGFDHCGLQIMSQEGTAGEAIAVRADSDEVTHTRVESWAGPVAAAWEKQEPVYRPDLEQEDRFGEADLLQRGIRSVVDVPFRYGTLALSSRQDKAFWPTDIETLQEFATAISGAYARYLDFQRLEAQNRALEQASRFKSDFLARMSHDLRTPMNAIIGYTRILLRKAKDTLDERQYRNLENIQLSASRLLTLINDILDLSRIEAGRLDLKPEPVDLNQLVATCAASVESLLKPGVALEQEVADLAPLHTDADRLSRVLMNLLSNAVKFTEAGRITVAAKPVEGGVELSVADTGIGIPAEDLPHIFEEFRQAERQGQRPEGSGLGLAIARKSVELLGGAISVESQVGKGTKFSLRIADYNL